MNKIFLIGYMGCGKTTLGRKLANALSFRFLDLDAEIEKSESRSISDIFAQDGEQFFRNLETKAIEKLSSEENIIISTGGGAPCFNDNIRLINDLGLSVYIKVEPNELYNRLKNETEQRPLLANKSKEELIDFIKEKLAERSKFYEQANLIYQEEVLGENGLIEKLKGLIENKS